MKFPESWLREWVNPSMSTEELAHQLTMLGHEVDAVDAEGAGLDGVVVADVLEVARHPDADRLSVCRIDAGDGNEPIDVVCGAPNVVAGMKAALAVPGVKLPNGVKLRKTKIRGVVSNGMLCSAVELGLGEESDGILELPTDAPVGEPLAKFLQLPDAIIDVNLTPNRGDCFSVLGMAREVAALTGAALKPAGLASPKETSVESVAVALPEPDGCPVFAGQVVSGIDPQARSPLWMVERLRRSGLRAIHPVVDITNYVMLELGQPLHAYDKALLRGTVRPVRAAGGETLDLLDGKSIEATAGTMLVTDDSGPIGLAGIMGGESTAVSPTTTDVFFEAAWWPPEVMAGKARSYGMHTDASLRFERGVDPTGQGRAVARATELLLAIAGGTAGPLNVVQDEGYVPKRGAVELRAARLARLLGVEIDAERVDRILADLGLDATRTADGWSVVPPAYRFDIAIEVDLIEEVARIHGYDSVPEATGTAALPLAAPSSARVGDTAVADLLIARDYQEVITYSFVDPGDDAAVSGATSKLALSNPISTEMAVMRSSLWVGMLQAASGNLSRQQDRVRLFEVGKTFHGTLSAPTEIVRVAGLVAGPAWPEQWGAPSRSADFFDIKSDVVALLESAGAHVRVDVAEGAHPALQPGQSAVVRRDGQDVGFIGKLHPQIARRFDIKPSVYLFEIDLDRALATRTPAAESVSRYPAIRRDIAVLVREEVTAGDLVAALEAAAPGLIRAVRIFDVYQGKGIEAGLKSVAIGLILQETSRTLTDEDADAAQAAAVQKLHEEFAAVLRD